MFNYIVTPNSITVLLSGVPQIIDNTHPNFEAVANAIKKGVSETELMELMAVAKVVEKYVQTQEATGLVEIRSGEIFYNGKAVKSALTDRIMSMMNEGFDISPFTKFMENLYQNPSNRALNETYGFLEACNLPITEDGCFLAYKKITSNYLDVYTRTIDNSIGAKPSVPRNQVDEDSERTCSYGLHVASYSYMSSYSGDRIVICKVNPKDVVAVPKDYNQAKMRVCEYEVISEVALHNEEIKDHIISDEEIEEIGIPVEESNAKEVQAVAEDENADIPYKNREDAILGIKTECYQTIKARLNNASVIHSEDVDILREMRDRFGIMNNRTKNWRNIMLDMFSLLGVPYKTIEEAIESVKVDKFKIIKSRIEPLRFSTKELVLYNFWGAIQPMTNSTSNWRTKLLNILEPTGTKVDTIKSLIKEAKELEDITSIKDYIFINTDIKDTESLFNLSAKKIAKKIQKTLDMDVQDFIPMLRDLINK